MIIHYGEDRLAETVQCEEYVKQALIFLELRTEWKAFRNYLSKQPRGTLHSQQKELNTNEMLQTMFLNVRGACKMQNMEYRITEYGIKIHTVFNAHSI